MTSRRQLLQTSLALGAMQVFPTLSFAQAKRLVFATFTGSWEEAHKAVLVPAFRKANNNADITLDPMLSVDQIAKVTAARNNPPIDVMLHDPGPALTAIGQDLVQPFPADKSAHYKDLIPEAQDTTGPAIFFQVVGLTYNPEKIKTPPTSWKDLWKPEFKGRVGITTLNSTLGTGWLVEVAKMFGGSESNVEPGFKAINELKPNLAAVAANPGALATLFQQGQIDISPGNFNAIQLLKARGVPVEFVSAQGRRDRVQDLDPRGQELAQPRAGRGADRSRDVARSADPPDAGALPDRADQHQGQDGRRDRQGAGQGPCGDEAALRVPGLEEDQRTAQRQWIERFNREVKV
jgi:putative spermidine/putrescine transport system substrate-binding protein